MDFNIYANSFDSVCFLEEHIVGVEALEGAKDRVGVEPHPEGVAPEGRTHPLLHLEEHKVVGDKDLEALQAYQDYKVAVVSLVSFQDFALGIQDFALGIQDFALGPGLLDLRTGFHFWRRILALLECSS